jgi:nucleotide-binding universal stress UspA family protein/hemerythrin-like domain-containing protein
MYQHLLVPIDGSPLTATILDQAIAFAKGNGSRITFLHAVADFGATGEGARLHAAAPSAFAKGAQGNSKAVLAKAQSVALARGIPCETVSVITDRPHEAILETATAYACDLIFMASHGHRGLKGLLLGSVTQKVLQQSTLPVLVATAESNAKPTDAQRALATIRDEHRSIAAVLHGLGDVVAKVDAGQIPVDFSLLRAMLYYIEKFPEALHHPKEDQYLFRLLQQRTDQCNAVIAELSEQHKSGAALFAQLRDALRRYESNEARAQAAFSKAVNTFLEAQWPHMAAEEKVILPAASRYLTTSDWQQIATAFLDNGDSRFGAQAGEPYEQLLNRVLNLLPATQKT